jgi:DNA-binding response OmpR family regulator
VLAARGWIPLKKRILVVDDEHELCELLKLRLSEEGLEVETSANGAEALLAAHARRPDLVLLDIAMPILDGHGTLAALRKSPTTQDIPVIMLTAIDDPSTVANSWASGIDFYITKPFELEELVLLVKRLLEGGA